MRGVRRSLGQGRGVADERTWTEQLWLPLFPLASDDYRHGVYRMARGEALKRRHVQANPDALANLLVVDIDHPDSALRALSATGNHPMPTAIVENPRNGHAHAVWALLEPVTTTERAKLAPLAYAASVAEGLRQAVDGDRGYSGLMTKNPVHGDWVAHWQRDELYSLAHLEHELGDHMPPPGWRKRLSRNEITGLGRNCALFEESRHWAYRELRHWFGDPQGLSDAIHAGVQLRNQAFTEPLQPPEAAGIARSITRWITTKSRLWKDGPVVYDATFSVIQAWRGKKGGKKSGEKRRSEFEAIREAAKGGR